MFDWTRAEVNIKDTWKGVEESRLYFYSQDKHLIKVK